MEINNNLYAPKNNPMGLSFSEFENFLLKKINNFSTFMSHLNSKIETLPDVCFVRETKA